MSWIPDFKIGLLNAWLLMLYIPLHPLIMILIDKSIGIGGIAKKMGDVPFNKAEKTAFIISTVLLFLMFVYSIFLPLKLVMPWFIIGIFFYFLGLAMFLSSIVTIATTPHGQPFTKRHVPDIKTSNDVFHVSHLTGDGNCFIVMGLSAGSDHMPCP